MDGSTDNTSLKEGLVDHDQAFCLVIVTKSHDLSIVPVGVDTSHDTLVVSKEEDGQASDGIDCNQERPFLVPTSCVP